MKRELWYSVVVRDRHGKVISRERRKSKSFVRGWNETVYVNVTGVSYAVKGTDGGSGPARAPHTLNFNMAEDATAYWGGIVIGTGNTAVDIEDFAMESAIGEGTGVGEMNYQASTVTLSVVSAPNCGFVVDRAFVNNSGGEITVRECGLYNYCYSASNFRCCGARDVLAVPQAVPNGGSISISYTVRVTA